MFDLTDRVVVVTGGSRGIGRAVAIELGRAGASVVVGYRTDVESAADTVRRVLDVGGDALAVPVDVRVALDIDRLVAEGHRWKGALHGVVANAGVYRGDALSAVGQPEWQAVMATDLEGTFRTIQAAAPYLENESGASVVTVSSILGQHPAAGGVPYQAAKAAIEQMTRGLAIELAPRIRVNCVAPGFIRTDMNRDGHTDPEFARRVSEATPLGRWGEPEDIAPAVRFLLSEEAGWLTGLVLPVDGGLPLP
ncbi:MAG TPA: SDR family oxidoreductase [Thermoplasmata archaeon]|nr:SDR family oxidoreductase [Thermoplasmata archaeon]